MLKRILIVAAGLALCSVSFAANTLNTPSTGTASAAETTGGIMPALASCCLAPVPAGQIMNSGYQVPSRAWLRILVIPRIYDSFKAYNGETLEEYGLKKAPEATRPKDGLIPAVATCCLSPVGLPQGQVMNSGYAIAPRTVFRTIPYVGSVVGLYDGFSAYEGEDMESFGNGIPNAK